MEPPMKRRKYKACFKLQVIEIAKKLNNSAAAREFNLSEKLVRDWRKKEDILRKIPKEKCALRSGITKWIELEDHVAKWVLEQRQNGCVLTRNMIRKYSLEWAELNPEKSREFKATEGWCARFMLRKNLLLQQKITETTEKLPEDNEKEITNFFKRVIRLRQRYKFPLTNIGNMTEIQISYDVDYKHTKQEQEKLKFTVIMSCMADGTKLKPMIIFKRKTKPNIKFPTNVFVHFHQKGLLDETGIALWINNVWSTRPDNKTSLLIWDRVNCHLPNVTSALTKNNTKIALIPDGLTSLLQPLDVCINTPFKDHLHEELKNSTSARNKIFNNDKLLSLLCAFVIKSWAKIKRDTVEESFKKCGISNAMDGSEDDLLWNPFIEDNDAYLDTLELVWN